MVPCGSPKGYWWNYFDKLQNSSIWKRINISLLTLFFNHLKLYFQAGRSFDLPNPDKYRHRHHMLRNNSNWGSGNLNTNSSKHNNEATITFDTPERGDSVDPSDMRHGKQASVALILFWREFQMCFPQGMHDNISVDSCHGTIRYQAVEGLVTNGRTMKNVVVRKQQGHPHGKSTDLGLFMCTQGDPSVQLKPPIDLGPTVMAAGETLQ